MASTRSPVHSPALVRVPWRDLGLAALGLASLFTYHHLIGGLTGLASTTWTPLPPGILAALWPGIVEPGPEPPVSVRIQLHAAAAVDLLLVVTALFVLYLGAVRLARGPATLGRTLVVLGFGALFQILAVLAPYALSGDVFSYAIYGRMFTVYGGSPYLELPAQYPGDPFFGHVYWKYAPSFYGPLWTLISGWIGLLAGHDVALSVLCFRLIAAASALLGAVIALLVLRRTDPHRALLGATLVAWCPFVVVECGLGAHNDALMALLVVGALALAWARRPALALAAVVLAGLVKLTALALVPLLGLYLLRTAPSWGARGGLVVRSALLCLPLAAGVVWPVWAGPATLSVGTLGSGPDRYVNSPGEAALGEVRVWLGASRDDLEVPLQFSGWWVGNHTETTLYAARTGDAALLTLEQWSELLVVGPERDDRLRVFDPASRTVGYVEASALGPIDPPPALLDDPEIQARQRGPVGSWDLNEANRLIRVVGWGAFALALLAGALLGTATLGGLAAAWVGLTLALDYLTLTWFWPWYVLWGLLPAALIPRARLTRLTVYLSWGVLLAYVCLGFENTSFWFLHNYRSVPMFGLPLVLFVADETLRGLAWGVERLTRRSPALPPGRLAAALRPPERARPADQTAATEAADPPTEAADLPTEAADPPTVALDPPTVALDPPTLTGGRPAALPDPPARTLDPPAADRARQPG